MKEEEKLDNTIMMIQVPLEVKQQTRGNYMLAAACSFLGDDDEECDDGSDSLQKSLPYALSAACCKPPPRSIPHTKGHGMDMGQLGLGSEAGKYTGVGTERTLKRDTRFPVRCTFQYYRVTDENFITEKNIRDIAEQLSSVEKVSLASGSLVCNEKGDRKTEPILNQPKPSDNPFVKLSSDVWCGQNMSGF